ncbi:MAG: Tol-Pal system beta propeller repeat protein TolB [Oleibacter sp.]|nr:Tol-Pal system beta propeller repeat protein TolB [Thalassolituus sp.]
MVRQFFVVLSIVFVTTFTTAFAPSAQAELVIEVTQGKQSAIPISVVPFQWAGAAALPEDVSAIVNNDLGTSGYFRTLSPAVMLSSPHAPAEVIYADWRRMNQDYLVMGNITMEEGEYAIEFYVIDVHRELKLIHHKVKGGASQLRDLAHYISDYVFQRLTGIPGVFSTKLVYVTTNEDRSKFNLNFADSDGAREQLIFKSKEPIMSPAWSPDGKVVAYVSFENGRSEIFFQVLATGRREKVVSYDGTNSAPAFSADGRYMAFVHSKSGNPDIYIMNLATRDVQQVTTHYAIDTEPQWMPDGEHILFTSSRAGGPQIYKLNVFDQTVDRVTFEGNYNARPRVTMDGRKMLYVHRSGDRFHIASQDLETGLVRILTKETNLDESPSVAPNGSMIIYAATENGRSILAAVSVDGEVKFRLPSRYGDVREPSWSPILQN